MTLIIAIMLALIIGYSVAIALYLLPSMVVTTSAPHFVPRRGHFRADYLPPQLSSAGFSTAVSSYIAATVSAAWFPWLPVFSLAVLVFVAAWFHPLEAQKQLGGLSRIAMSTLGTAGVVLGFYLKLKQ